MHLERKKTLFLSYDGLTDPLGQSQVIPYLIGINETSKYHITIISFEKKNNYLKNKITIENLLKINKISWVPLRYTKSPPIISTLWDVYKLNNAVKSLLKQNIHLIHCRSYITSLVALKVNRKTKIPFIFDMRGFYADERVDGKIWDKNHFIFKHIYNYFKKKERAFFQESSHVVSLTYTGKKEIESWKLPKISPISVIPCCTDEKLFQPENIKPINSELDLNEDDFIITYVGSLGTWYMLDEMLDFFKVLLTKIPSSKFLFITKDNPELIINKAKEKGIDKKNIRIQPSPRDLMPSYINASTYSIFFILPVFSKKASSPTKMGEIMSLGIPIICNSGVGDVDEIMNECMPELLVQKFNRNEYERVIDLIFTKPLVDKKKIINTSSKYYSLEKGVKKYQEIYSEILG